MHEYSGNFLGMHFLWWLLLITVIVGILLAINNQKNTTVKETPLEILKKRFAKGEITEEEYEKAKEALINTK